MAGNTALGGSVVTAWISPAPASAMLTSTPTSRRASLSRSPDRSETSRSGYRPPARISTCPRSLIGWPGCRPGRSGPPGRLSRPRPRRAEGGPGLGLGAYHLGEAADPLPDPGRLGEAVGEPNVGRPAAVGV